MTAEGHEVAAALVSYPKSGRTWLRFMLAHYLQALTVNAHLPPVDLETMFHVIPNTGDHPQKGADALWAAGPLPRPAIVAAHGAGWLRRPLPAVLLLRDPAEVLVSHFHHERAHRPAKRFSGSFGEFVASERGVPRLAEFLTIAGDHVDDPEVLVLTYDMLSNDTAETVGVALHHVGVAEIDISTLAAAVAAGSFESMARMEGKSGMVNSSYDYEDPDARRVRAGVADRGRTMINDTMRAELIAEIHSRIGSDRAKALRRGAPEDWAL